MGHFAHLPTEYKQKKVVVCVDPLVFNSLTLFEAYPTATYSTIVWIKEENLAQEWKT